jgi:autotransporter-associated beta strand protein
LQNGNVTVTANSGLIIDRNSAGSPGQTLNLGTLAIGASTLTADLASRVNSTSSTMIGAFSGTTTLTGAPTFVTNNASVTAGGATLTLPGFANAGNTITVRPGDRTTIGQNGVWSGTGAVVVDSLSSGTLNLTQVNTFTGGVTVNAGSLKISANSSHTSGTVTQGATGTGNLTVANNTTIDNAGSITWYTPQLTTSGTVKIVGGNRLNVSLKTWDMGGGTQLVVNSRGLAVNSGTLASDSTGLSSWEIGNTLGTMTFQNGLLDLQTTAFSSGTYAAFRFNNGSSVAFASDAELKIGPNVMLISNGSFISGSAARVTIEAGGILNSVGADNRVASLAGGGIYTPSLLTSMTTSRLLEIQGTSGTASFSGTLQDGQGAGAALRVWKSGIGTQVLAGNNTYSGTTTVTGGVLSVAAGGALANTVDVRVNGGEFNVNGTVNALALVTATNGGTVSGTGTIGNLTVSLGTVAPGNSIGTLTTGDLSLRATGTFALEIDTTTLTGASDMISSGALSITEGAKLTISDLNGSPQTLTFGSVLTIIDYTGAWDGNRLTYSSNLLDDGEWFTFGVNTFEIDYDYGGSSVALLVVPEPSTVALSLLAGAGMLLMRRRRR